MKKKKKKKKGKKKKKKKKKKHRTLDVKQWKPAILLLGI